MGKTIATVSGERYTIRTRIAEGAQGTVARATNDRTGEDVAVKLLNNLPAPELQAARRRLEALVARRDELPESFVLPFDIFESPRLGYVMPLVTGMDSLETLLSSRDVARSLADFPLDRRLKACFRMASAFREIHTRGMFYADISWANILVNKANGDIRIIDNDNLDAGGRSKAAVLGTPWFIAPELVSHAKDNPDCDTDYHSLATLIYYMLVLDHPLIGDRVAADSQENEERWLGADALFVHHPTDRRNQSTFGGRYHHLPERLRNLFNQAFVSGLHDPMQRVNNGTWRRAIMATLDELVACPVCKSKELPARGESTRCPACDRGDLSQAMFIELRGRSGLCRKAANPTAGIYAHHWDPNGEFDFSAERRIARIVDDARRGLALQNLSRHAFEVRCNGAAARIQPTQYIKLRRGLELSWGPQLNTAVVV